MSLKFRPALRALITLSLLWPAVAAAQPTPRAEPLPTPLTLTPGNNVGEKTIQAGADDTLGKLLAEALQNNPEILAARSEQQAAAQRVAPAGALDDPMLEAGVLNLPTSSFSFSREEMTMKMLGLSQRFPYPGKRALKRDVAQLDSESLEYGYAETVNRVARDITVAYNDLAVVTTSMSLVNQNRGIVQQLMKIADVRYSVGQGNQVDVLRAQTQLSRMSEELLKLGREYNVASSDLARALGRRSPAGAVAARLELREAPLNLSELREHAVEARPQLLALRAIADRNQRAIDVARSERYPDFDVRFSYGQRDRMPDGARRSDMVSLTVAMNLPVWRQTKTLPRIAEAVAMQEQAMNMLEAQRNETLMKLAQQIAAAEQNLRALRLYRNEIIPQSRLTVEAATAAYQVGRSDFALLLDNQMSVLNFQLAEATATANYNKALAEINFLIGRSPSAVASAVYGEPK